jgi:glycosyltransferase involved in cell wall biosynthesis
MTNPVQKLKQELAPKRRMKIAYFSPLPPQRSGIADYSLELLPELAELVDLTVFTAQPSSANAALQVALPLLDYDAFPAARERFDFALYHIGNSEHHDEIVRLARRYPGIVVLHDFFLHHAAAQRTLGAGDALAYAREMGYARGAAGVRQALDIQAGHGAVPAFEVPLNERLLDASLGVIVHSQYAARQVRKQDFERPLHVVPALVGDVMASSRRTLLGLDEDAVLLASFGLITAEKQITAVLRALQTLRQTGLNVHYLLVGDRNKDVPLDVLIGEFGLQGVVHVVGFAPNLDEFVGWIQAADVVINLRYPTVGETSATALRALMAGRPLLVYDHGWYAELPAEVAMRIPPRDDEALPAALQVLGSSAALRLRMGDAARAYALRTHAPATVANAYHAALEAVLAAYLPAELYG